MTSSKTATLGLFGGRFDPVHRMHLRLAVASADQLELPCVHWLVTGQPVHKPAEASSEDRLAMTRLALDWLADERMILDDREVYWARDGQASASYKTIESFQEEFPEHTLVWILGEDQLEFFTRWQNWDWIIRQVELAVCSRPSNKPGKALGELETHGANIRPVAIEPDRVSSTQIREQLKQGWRCFNQELVSPPVSSYLQSKKLYCN
ncbi:MAG: nicotinate (nicotinamide) nucleotide adenylyltransferase [Bordetella sp.]